MKMATSTSQVLTHRNSNHAADSFQRLSKLRREGILCDLTILVQGQKFKAHKAVMAACSDYFLTAICGGKSTASVSVTNGANGSHMTIELQYVTMRGFAPLLEYAYTSDLQVSAADVIDVLAAASYMQMFEVANACSEFMRSNLLWTQNPARLSGLPLMAGRRPLILNGHNDERSSSSPVHGRLNGLPEAMTNLLQATSAMTNNPTIAPGAAGLGRPPMLIPISSMNPYEVNLQKLADTMAAAATGSNLISTLMNGTNNGSSPLTMSPTASSHNSPSTNWMGEKRPSSLQAPVLPERPNSSELARSEGASPKTKDEPARTPEQNHLEDGDEKNSNNNNNNNNANNYIGSEVSDGVDDDKSVGGNGSSSRKSSVAVKVESTPDDEMHAIARVAGQPLRDSPQADSEDSWQSLQRLYSFNKSEAQGSSPGKSPVSGSNGLHNGKSPDSLAPLLSQMVSNNGMKLALDKYKDAIPKLDNSLSMVHSGLSMQRALLHHQQLLAQQHLQQSKPPQQPREETEKLIPELPAVPPGGQYMSVRRRTLQSNVPKPHQCQICGSRFTRFHNLKQHIKLHSGIKPYECDECGKRFTRNYTLRLHKMKHVGLRNFRCGTCDAAFTSLGEFRAHLRITMHSHLPAVSSEGSPQPSSKGMEPEDLSNSQVNGVPVKFGQFDCSLLNYEAGSPGSSGGRSGGEGSTGTMSPPRNSNDAQELLAVDSPQLSDRSFAASPQDLSTKRPLSEDDELRRDEMKRSRCASESPTYKDELEDDMVGVEPVPLVIDQGVLADGTN